MPPEFSGKWRIDCPSTRFPQPTLPKVFGIYHEADFKNISGLLIFKNLNMILFYVLKILPPQKLPPQEFLNFNM